VIAPSLCVLRSLSNQALLFISTVSARPLELERVWIPALWQLPQKARGICSPYTVPLRPALLRPSSAAAGFVKFKKFPFFGSARHALFGVRSSSSRATHWPFSAIKSSVIASASARPLELERVWIPAFWQLPQKARGLCSPYTMPLRPALLRPSTVAAAVSILARDFCVYSADACA
jgi:hypothetical protein